MPDESLVESLALEEVDSRERLVALARQLAERLARELEERGLAWQEVQVRLRAAGRERTRSTLLPRQAPPAGLPSAVARLLETWPLPGPAEHLALRAARLMPLAFAQLDLTGGRHADREHRLEAALREVNRRYPLAVLRGGASAGTGSAARRERMLAFYDPLRGGGRDGE
ncbi:MAG: hypothetical protein IRZ26_00950 [Clostridia bacterium]|nr:hypothetical protein [Clostridia bacterium]